MGKRRGGEEGGGGRGVVVGHPVFMSWPVVGCAVTQVADTHNSASCVQIPSGMC